MLGPPPLPGLLDFGVPFFNGIVHRGERKGDLAFPFSLIRLLARSFLLLPPPTLRALPLIPPPSPFDTKPSTLLSCFFFHESMPGPLLMSLYSTTTMSEKIYTKLLFHALVWRSGGPSVVHEPCYTEGGWPVLDLRRRNRGSTALRGTLLVSILPSIRKLINGPRVMMR